MATLLLSDLHLPPGQSPLRDGFLQFVQGPARDARAVYILGDLFEYWIGDEVGMRDYGPETAALAQLVKHGVPVWFQHGNRDFLVGRRFAAATGLQLLPDPCVRELEGMPTLLSHGDLYCTGDTAYQRWRRFSRNPVAQALFGLLPEARRRRIAGGLRGSSQQKRYTPEDIMDVNPNAIREAFRAHGVTRMIHGHTHRPALHTLQVEGRDCERFVLADWTADRLEYVRADRSGLQRIRL